MKRTIVILLLMAPLVASGQRYGSRQWNNMQSYNAPGVVAAQADASANAQAAQDAYIRAKQLESLNNQKAYIASHQWLTNSVWRNCQIWIDVSNKALAKDLTELTLRGNATEWSPQQKAVIETIRQKRPAPPDFEKTISSTPEGARLLVLCDKILNELRNVYKWRETQEKIESQYKLKQFYEIQPK